MNDRLLDIFTDVETEADLRAKFVKPRHAETTYLEFKEKSDSRVPDLSESERRNFAKALSAFSNADGGFLIWGIRTKRTEGKDCASTLKPIQQVESFAERLRDSLVDVLIPQNAGVRIEALKNRLGNGYLKCYIPSSDNRPHRSMVDREYWIRLDGRSTRMDHFLIRDMMTQRANPDLNLELISDYRHFPNNRVRLTVSLRNTGRAVAKYCGWTAVFVNASVLTQDPSVQNHAALNEKWAPVSWAAQPAEVIHPHGIGFHTGSLVLEIMRPGVPAVAWVTWYCEDMSPKNGVFRINVSAREKPIAGNPIDVRLLWNKVAG